MTVKQLVQTLALEVLCEGDADKAVTGAYCGDLLSWVMGRAQSGDAWVTVMGNVNAVAVAVLADVACVILAEESPLDDAAKQRAEMQGVWVLRSEKNSYQLCTDLSRLL